MTDFENKLLKCLLDNPKIIQKNIDILKKEELFQNAYNRYILQHIIEYYEAYNEAPKVEFLCDKIITEMGSDDKITKIILDHININIIPIELTDGELQYLENNIKLKLKDNILNKTQEKIGKLQPKQIEEVLEQVVELSQNKETYSIKMIWDELEDMERQPLTTGLELIDTYGVGKGEIGVMLAGTGVGKSVFLTYLANNFMLNGYKVLHIVFEGNQQSYLRLHRIKLGNPTTAKLKKGKTIPNLQLIQLKSNETTTKDIQKLIQDRIEEGFNPDVIVLDYLDCLVGEDRKKQGWENDIKIINELEHICQKYDIGLWTAIQANRSGVNKELSLENISGSISKAQKACMVLALERRPEQQHNNRADVRILKNRFGGLQESRNCIWNPEQMIIELPLTETIIL